MLGGRAGRLEEWSGMSIVERGGKWELGEGEAGRRGRLMGGDMLDEQIHLEVWYFYVESILKLLSLQLQRLLIEDTEELLHFLAHLGDFF